MIFFPTSHIFPSPEPLRERRRIYPLFLPFSGCPMRCVFCAQDTQTGRAPESVSSALARAERALAEREARQQQPLDLAFFGGTFTALETQDLRACLAFAAHWKERGGILDVRCSTRPDALSPAVLASLKAAGFSLVELGVQSFCDNALATSRRGYGGVQARDGCERVLASGLKLGVQLMPGMPGSTPESALQDAAIAASFAPACARLYPCLVLAGTTLADLWRQGRYLPWDLEAMLELLASACLTFWRSNIPVIRIGLAQEPGLEEHILAGPRHPGLGGMAKGKALYLYLREQVEALVQSGDRHGDRSELFLHTPAAWQGAFWGDGGALEREYASLGLVRSNVRWWGRDFFALTRDWAEG